MSLQRVSLPGELQLWAANEFEATALYRQVVSDRVYERHGVVIQPGDTIFDIGANIGLFSLHMTQSFSGVKIHAFEPVPQTFEALSRNLQRYCPNARVYNLGLADKAGEAVFELDQFATMSATMHSKTLEQSYDRNAGWTEWAKAALADFDRIVPNQAWVRLSRRGLEVPGVRVAVMCGIATGFLGLQIRRKLFLKHPKCRLQTLSAMLAETGVDHVDLVKIDVEGAEEAVLAGIADSDWKRLRQLVIEVHDLDGRVKRLRDLLESRGYRTTWEADDWDTLRLMGISTLYAVARS